MIHQNNNSKTINYFTKFSLILFLFLSAIALNAQNKKAFDALEKKNYALAESLFRKDLSDDGADLVAAQYGLAKIFQDTQSPVYQIDSAFLYADKVNYNLSKSNNDIKDDLKKYNITLVECGVLRSSTFLALHKVTLESKNLERIEKTIKITAKVKDAKLKKLKDEMLALKSSLVIYAMDTIQNYTALGAFYGKYEKEVKLSNEKDQIRVQKILLTKYIAENGWSKVAIFEKAYPNNIFIKDAGYTAFKKILESNDNNSFKDFVLFNEKSLWANIANDTLALRNSATILENGSIKEWISFVQDYPNSKLIPQLDDKISSFFEQNHYLSFFQKGDKKINSLKIPKTMATIVPLFVADGRSAVMDTFKVNFINYEKITNFEQYYAFTKEAELLQIEYNNIEYQSIQAERYDKLIKNTAPNYLAFKALQKMIKNDLFLKNWKGALKTVEQYDAFFKDDVKFKDLKQILLNTDEDIKIINIGENINSQYSEYCPTVTADGKTMFFCRDLSKNEDIYKSNFVNDKWMPAEKVNGLSMAVINEAPLAVTADGTNLLMFDEGTIKISNKNSTNWGTPKNISEQINTGVWQGETTISSNGQVLIFESYREDIEGLNLNSRDENVDFYISFKDKKGNWKTATNLGSDINTPFVERSPYLHPDMKTLYFCSEGHGGIGYIDVFKTTRLDETWKHWSKPINLGKEINTVGLDWGYKISTSGVLGYFSSNDDIFFVTPIPKLAQPEKVATIKGKILTYNKLPITDAEIRIINLSTGETAGTLRTDPQTGEYFAVLPQGNYGYELIKDGYFPIHGNINTQDLKQQIDVLEDVTLYKYSEMKEKNIALPIRNLFFDTNSFVIKPESYNELNELAEIVKKNNFNIEIGGHTDNEGDTKSNLVLSENRAREVKSYLVGQGCSATNITAKGYGESKPVTTNKDAGEKSKNRRVDVRVKK